MKEIDQSCKKHSFRRQKQISKNLPENMVNLC